MTTIGEAIIEVRGDASHVASDVERGASTSRMSAIGSVAGKGLALGFTAAAGGILAGGAFLKGAFDEAQESIKVGAQTTAVLKSTGGQANVTANDIGNLATSISNKIGVDDEAIQAGENMLLTFTNVRNEVGKGNDIFNQATVAANDMAAAFGGDATSNSKILGKALNDPTKGISALTRVGVTFTDQQKKQIAALQASGDMAGAQKIILGELTKETGGSAAAQATAADKMSVAWGNLKEQIGLALMPAFNAVFGIITTKVIPGLSMVGPVISQIIGYVKPFISTFIGGFSAGGAESGKFGAVIAQLRPTFQQVFAAVKSIVISAVQIITVLWRSFGSTIVSYIANYLKAALLVIRGIFNVIAGVFKVFSALLRGDWKGVWQGILQILRGVWQIIKGVVRQGWNVIKTLFTAAGIAIKGIFGRLWDGLKRLVVAGFQAQVGLAKAGASSLIGLFQSIPGRILAIGGKFLDAGKSIIGKIFDGIRNGAGGVGSFIADIASSIKGAINSALHLPFTINGPGPLPDFTIPAFAKGTDSAPGGLALVGENGPELVNLRRGAQVITASRTRALARSLAAGGGGGGALRLVAGSLTIDEGGEAWIRGLAADEVDSASEFAGTMGRMGR